jgi:PAS domain S-box-containing protein
MKTKPVKVLIIDQDERDYILTSELFSMVKVGEYDLDWAASYEDGLKIVSRGEHDVCLLGHTLGEKNGVELIREARAAGITTPMILLTGVGDREMDVESMMAGATDYMVKDETSPSRLERTVRYAVQLNNERKRADVGLRSSELRYRRLFESAKDGILILDADSGQVIDVNAFLIQLLGFPKEEFLGKELWQIGLFKDIAASKVAFTELQERGYIRYENLPLETRGGSVRLVEFVSNSYMVGTSRVIQCNIRDITERKQAEGKLKEANQRLEQTLAELQAKRDELASMTEQLWQASKLATMGELAASIAHELNNPLATVGLHAETLLMKMPEGSDQRKPLEIIAQEVDRMASLVNNLLQFSRRSCRQVSTVDPRVEISNSVEFVHYHLRTRKIEVVCDFADPLPTIQADRPQLQQVFLNLLTNACDAMSEGGKLTMRANSGLLNNAEAVAIEFADTGEGITSENLNKIWNPFFTTKPEGKGTGLGLAICRRLVEQHGGTIDIQSQPGRGTSVRLLFPATSTEAPG